MFYERPDVLANGQVRLDASLPLKVRNKGENLPEMTGNMLYEHAIKAFLHEIIPYFTCNYRPANYIKSIRRNPAAT